MNEQAATAETTAGLAPLDAARWNIAEAYAAVRKAAESLGVEFPGSVRMGAERDGGARDRRGVRGGPASSVTRNSLAAVYRSVTERADLAEAEQLAVAAAKVAWKDCVYYFNGTVDTDADEISSGDLFIRVAEHYLDMFRHYKLGATRRRVWAAKKDADTAARRGLRELPQEKRTVRNDAVATGRPVSRMDRGGRN